MFSIYNFFITIFLLKYGDFVSNNFENNKFNKIILSVLSWYLEHIDQHGILRVSFNLDHCKTRSQKWYQVGWYQKS